MGWDNRFAECRPSSGWALVHFADSVDKYHAHFLHRFSDSADKTLVHFLRYFSDSADKDFVHFHWCFSDCADKDSVHFRRRFGEAVDKESSSPVLRYLAFPLDRSPGWPLALYFLGTPYMYPGRLLLAYLLCAADTPPARPHVRY